MFRNLNKYRFNHSFYFLFILLTLNFLFFLISDVSAATQASFRWEPNTEPDLAGYRIFHREQSQSYNYANPSWEGTDTYCTIYDLDESTTHFFVARAFDNEGYESENSIEARLEPGIIINIPPTAVVTPDYLETTGETLVTLDGSASTDSDDGIASYLWTQVEGDPVLLSNSTSVVTTFTTPQAESFDKNIEFQLTVTDHGGLSDTTNSSIYVMQNETPTLNSVTISGPVQVNEGSGTQYILTANYSDGGSIDVTSLASWSDNSSFASITSYGNLIASSVVSDQSCMITASYEGRSDTHSVTIADLPQSHSPAVAITSPGDGSGFTESDPVGFDGTAEDTEDGDLATSLTWSSNLDGPIGAGGSFVTNSLSLGTHIITVTVTDSEGLTGSDSVSITIAESGSFDVLDFDQTPTVAYSNQDRDGTVTIEDGGATLHMQGNRWRRTEQVYEITPDTVLEFDFMSTIEGEIHGIGFEEDDNLTNGQRIFQLFGTQTWSTAYQWSPPYTAADMGSYVHFSIPLGQYYTGSNMHLAFVSDDDGAVIGNSWFKNVRVVEGRSNLPPEVAITSPGDSSSYIEGDPVGFDGTAEDTEDGDLAISLTWSSNLDGLIGAGGSFAINSLSLGTHTITATVTDSEGLSGNDSVSITITQRNNPNEPPTAVVTPDYLETTGETLVTLDGSASTDSDDGIAAYLWTQVEGDPVSLSNPTSSVTTFTTPKAESFDKNIELKLTVTDHGGLSDTTNSSIYVMQNESPTLNSVTITGPVQVNEGSGAQYTLTANYSDGGSIDVTSLASWSDNSSFASITSYGNLIASSVVSDQSCMITASYESRSDTHNVTIADLPQNHSPAVDFSYTTWGTFAIFRDRSTDSDGSVVSWLWDFGDGKYSTRQNPWHRYGGYGNYSVTLTVTDNEGVSNSISKTVSITR